ncbi:MAG TPA: transcription repressor NadR [Chloroflexota bacterium]|nr:transcription repressor NadR [Chloroflexota bacterium]
MRGQRGEERRAELVRRLRTSSAPILGADLAAQFGVSRQVLVQDMAILRAAGIDIIATPRGYLLRGEGPVTHADTLQVQHTSDEILDELTILVDLGIRVVDVAIDHPVYGTLRGELNIASRQDAREYIERLETSGSRALLELTGGRHSHAVEAPRPDLLERARAELRERGFLVP